MKRGLQVVLTLLVLGALGAATAYGISSALGIRVEPKEVPAEVLRAAPPRESVAPPRVRVTAPDGVRLDAARAELRDATADGEGTATLRVRFGDGDDDDDSYRLTGTADQLRIRAASETGAVRGVYDLAQAAWAHRPLTERLGETVTSRLPFRMVDLGAAGVDPDPEQWRGGTDYSHYSRAFEDVLLPEAPWIDEAALADAREDLRDFAEHVLAQGYNAVTVPGFLEYVTFAEVPEVYADDPEYVARAEAVRDAFGPLWAELDELGLDVYLRTDMLVLSTPLERHLTERFDLDPTDPGLWDVYEAALDELYGELPQLSGVVLRIGEGGSIYNTPGIDYFSEITVTTAPAVRAMLDAFTGQAERADKDVVFRTWSVGVGAVGDMHTNPESYDEVLAGVDSPRLVVSTKYSLGDFYSWLPLNETLEQGTQRRIVEMQSRREFESFGTVPNDLGVLHQLALRRFLAANPHVEGVWTWTQDGGPWRAGPRSLLLTTGFWQLYDLNTEVAGRLARDPDADPAELTADWVRRWLSTDPDTVAKVTEALALSREAVTHGQYVPQFAEVRAFALGLEPPPQMLLFEWDILTGDSAVLDVLYAVTRDSGPGGGDGGDRRRAARDRRRHDHARPRRRHRRDDLPRPRAARAAARLARLPGRPARPARRLPRDGAAPRAVARHRRGPPRLGDRPSAVRRGRGAARGDVRRRPGTAGLQPHRRPDRRGARGPRPPDGVAGPRRPGGPAARPRPDPHRPHPRPHRGHAVARPRPGVAVAGGGAAGGRGGVEPTGADVVPGAEPPARRRPRLGRARHGRRRRDVAHPLVARRDRGRRRGGPPVAAAARGPGLAWSGWLLVRLLDRARSCGRRTSWWRSSWPAGCSPPWCGRWPPGPWVGGPRRRRPAPSVP